MKKLKLYFLSIVFSIVAFFSYSFTTSDVDYFEISKNLDIFISLFKEININYVDEVDANKVIRTGIDAMLEELDPYTVFHSESEVEDFRIQTTGKYGGIGCVISKQGKHIVLVDPYEGSPSVKSGVIAGDRLLEVNGKNMVDKSTGDASNLLKGAAGTKVSVKVLRLHPDGDKKLDIDIMREEIKLKNIPYSGMINDKVGYIKLENFMTNAGGQVRKAFVDLKAENPSMNSIILDLRNNPGGLLHEAVKTSNVFIDENEEIVSTKGKVKERQTVHRTKRRAADNAMPLVVLTNGGSASASEIVAGSIQDLDRGIIIGAKTFGKGLVQNTRPLPYQSQLKVTTAKYYIPSGRCIQAINYAEKNPDGSVKKIPDSLKKAFKTKGGRTVYDGGGIDPDVSTKDKKYDDVIYYLVAKGMINDYATKYYFSNSKPTQPENVSLSDNDYADFIKFIKDNDFSYETPLNNSLKSFEEVAENQELNDELKNEIEQLKNKLQQLKENDLTENKDDIKVFLEKEIAKRYFFTEGKIKYGFKKDKEIKRALELFNNPSEYAKLLKK